MARKITNELIDLCEQGIVSWESIARECLCYMSEYDVKDMNDVAQFIEETEEVDDEN